MVSLFSLLFSPGSFSRGLVFSHIFLRSLFSFVLSLSPALSLLFPLNLCSFFFLSAPFMCCALVLLTQGAAHQHGVVHRDLKFENVLRSGDRILLCDFGIARDMQSIADALHITTRASFSQYFDLLLSHGVLTLSCSIHWTQRTRPRIPRPRC